MPSTAISAQGTSLKIGTTAGAKTITAATQANPVKLTCAAHALTDGTVVLLAAFVGMTQLNGQVGVVRVVDANSFELPGINSTAYGAYASGGTATPTQVTVGNLLTYNGPDGQAADIDITNLASTSKEYLVGLQDNGNFAYTLNPDDADPGQQALLGSRAGSLKILCLLTLRNGKTRTFNATCKQFAEQAGVDQALTAQISMRVTGDVTRG